MLNTLLAGWLDGWMAIGRKGIHHEAQVVKSTGVSTSHVFGANKSLVFQVAVGLVSSRFPSLRSWGHCGVSKEANGGLVSMVQLVALPLPSLPAWSVFVASPRTTRLA